MYQRTFFVETVCNENKVIIQFWACYIRILTTRSIFITVSICHLLVGEYLKGFKHQMSLFLIFHILKFLARLITKIWVLTTEAKKFSNFPPQGQWLTTTALRRPPEKAHSDAFSRNEDHVQTLTFLLTGQCLNKRLLWTLDHSFPGSPIVLSSFL